MKLSACGRLGVDQRDADTDLGVVATGVGGDAGEYGSAVAGKVHDDFL
ncbi:hypothetical protein [Plantactinospora veratri]